MYLFPILLLSFFAFVYFIAYRKDWKRDKEGFKNALSYIKYLVGGLALLISFNIVGNLFFNEEKFGHDFNSTRQKIGMMTIPDDWVGDHNLLNSWTDYLTSNNSSYNKLYFSKSKEKSAIFTSKFMSINDNKIKYPTDYFHKDSNTISITHYYPDSTFEYTLQRNDRLDDTAKNTVLDSLRNWKVLK